MLSNNGSAFSAAESPASVNTLPSGEQMRTLTSKSAANSAAIWGRSPPSKTIDVNER